MTPGHQCKFDVAVVGGGISGVYSAWRLRLATADQLGGELAALARDSQRASPRGTI